MTVKIFICYAREDEPLLNQLKAHLRPLQHQGLIEVWHDREISAGTEWEQEIDKHLNEAQIILLLISPDFMNSDYCYGIEMKKALERHKQAEVRVIPVILRHVYWQGVLGDLQALPKDARPVKSWPDQDEAFYNVTEAIREQVESLMIVQQIFQSQSLWLLSAFSRAGRIYVETHVGELLSASVQQFLELFIDENRDSPSDEHYLRTVQALLRDIRARGGTRQAVRDGYVNFFGGMILDLPPHLLELDHRLSEVSSPAVWTERMQAAYKMQLRDAINYISTDSQIAPEIAAELQYQLGRLFANKSGRMSANMYEMVVDCYHASLRVYTAKRYPRQYDKVQTALAEAKRDYQGLSA